MLHLFYVPAVFVAGLFSRNIVEKFAKKQNAKIVDFATKEAKKL